MTGPLLSWLEGSTSPIDVQAIEPTKTLGFPSSLVPKLVARSPAWNGILKTHLEALAHRTEQRALSLLEHTPEARYRQFMAEEPQLCERLSLKQIAAYLGITDVSLSRIRRRLNKG
jgi:CRP-like cAMP-binding protein